MSGYRDYISSASGAIMDLVSDAACTVQSVAASTYTNMSESLQVHCQTVAERLLNYKYQDRSLMDTSPDYPDTIQPIWILGEKWSAKHDLEDLREIVQTRLWFTYRRDFPSIGSSECTSDQGWGCMLRCGQMLLGSCLLDLHLSRKWRWNTEAWKNKTYRNIVKKFQDNKSAEYSIHQISLMGESVENKPVGTWFGPNTVVQVLRKLVRMDPSNDLAIHVAMDNTLIISEVKQACLQTPDSAWRPLLLCISLRLGLTEINPVYVSGLKTCLSLPQAQGVLGGRPNHAFYILGFVEDEAIYLDPHVTQPYVDIESWERLQADSDMFGEGTKVNTCDNVSSGAATDSTEPKSEAASAATDSTESTGKTTDSKETSADCDQRTFEVSEESDHVRHLELVEREDRSFHVNRPGRISIDQLDPSLSVCFFCRTEQDFDNLCIELQEKLLSVESTPLFEMMLERPPHMYPQSSSDISVQPDEMTGNDYERIDRKYDSEEEFEII